MLRQTLRTAENRLMKAVRDRRSVDVLDRPATRLSVRSLRGHRHILLVTTRRDGREVTTPMWFAADGEQRLIMRSGATDPKLARIRNHPDVRVAACNLRGRPLGVPMSGRARILRPDEEGQAELIMRRALGWKRDAYTFFRGPLLPMAYIEIEPADRDLTMPGV